MKLIKTFNLSEMGVNCYILNIDNEVIIIDCPKDFDTVIDYFKKNELCPSKLLMTHYHFDHMLGIDLLKENYPDVDIYCNKNEGKYLFDPKYTLAELYGISYHNKHVVKNMDELKLKDLRIEVLPGHSPYSSVFIFDKDRIAFVGDTLFKGSIGRTDLPYGDSINLISNINKILLTLEDDFIIYPGHGSKTTIKEEKTNNLFLK